MALKVKAFLWRKKTKEEDKECKLRCYFYICYGSVYVHVYLSFFV